MARVPDIDPDTLDPAQKEVYDRIASGPRGQVRGPYHAWLLNPGYCAQIEAMGRFLRFEATLPGNLRELGIITVARHWRAEFEWFAHAPIAIREGVSEDVVRAIENGEEPVFEREDEALIHAFAKELMTTGRVSQATYDRAEAMLGRPGLVELAGLLGHYCSVAMTLNVFQIVPAEDHRPAFRDRD